MNGEGILRVGGRLTNSAFAFAFRHPIIITQMPFFENPYRSYSSKYHHAGVKLLTSIVRQRFYVPGIRGLIRSSVRSCIVCVRFRGTSYNPEMGSFPECRFELVKPFETSGIDFAGPLEVRPYHGRGKIGLKSYIAIIVCMVTKATHLELVFSLSTESLVMALKRFVAKRGRCGKLISDNGKNFVGCNSLIKETRRDIIQLVEDAEVKRYLLDNLIE
ncbi:uncharacterized protein LOC122520376 [Polistes fuscatus]|uniref:uncharacterized protein LOC122520376 n=1 Tax=Polistes fuscatus TaxID=30207 RepID=UPI001CA97AFF|nr:uncharacterized protein LOC122520376 [Polistes fuscatus]